MKKIILTAGLALGVLAACRENIDEREHPNDAPERTTSEYPPPVGDTFPADHTSVHDTIH